MKWSEGHFYTLKDDPADAELPSHKLMVRGGYIRKLAQGIYTYGPLALKSIRKLETIVREELDKAGCVELLMPMVQPKEIWEESGRWEAMGKGLLRFKNRSDQEWCLGATHEEVITDYARKDLKSYRDVPVILYQIQTKYRDEIRPRFGLLRGREFIMKDAYSFDPDIETTEESYQKMLVAYRNIFSRLGLEFRIVDADSGDMGGNKSQEFHVLAESGEDQLLVAEEGEFAANAEVCPAIDFEPLDQSGEKELPMEEFPTPGLKTIADLAKSLKKDESELIKTMFFSIQEEKEEKPIAVLLRGSDEVNPIKIKLALGLKQDPVMLTDEEVKKVTGANPGSCGPVGLKIPVYADTPVEKMRNFTVGANKDDFHLKNVNPGRDFKIEKTVDIRMARDGDRNPDGSGKLKAIRGIEAGHIFVLGDKYTKAMGVNYLDKNGKAKTVQMGCYGLGVSRTVQAAIEQNHDADGIVWPLPLAPFHVHVCLLDPKDKEASKVCDDIVGELESKNVEVLVDDRNERPGFKFKDADLLGMPVRLNIGGRGIKNGEVEVVERKTKEMTKVPIKKAVTAALDLLEKLKV